jgi:hypothetical protein
VRAVPNLYLGQRIVVNLSAGDPRAIASRHVGDLLFLTIRGGDQSVLGDLKIAAAFNARLGGRRQQRHQQECRAAGQAGSQDVDQVVSFPNRKSRCSYTLTQGSTVIRASDL